MSGELSSSDFVSEQGSDTDHGEAQRAQIEGWLGKLQVELQDQPPAPASESSELQGTGSFSQESQMLREELEAAQNIMEGFFQKLAPKDQTARRDSSGFGNYDSRESWNKQDKTSYLSAHSGFSAETLQNSHLFPRRDSQLDSKSASVKIDDAAHASQPLASSRKSITDNQEEKSNTNISLVDNLTKLAIDLCNQTANRLSFEDELQEYRKFLGNPPVNLQEELQQEQNRRKRLDSLLITPSSMTGFAADTFNQYIDQTFYAWLPAHLARPCAQDQPASSQPKCPHAGWHFDATTDVRLPDNSRNRSSPDFSYSDPDLVPMDRHLHPLFVDCTATHLAPTDSDTQTHRRRVCTTRTTTHNHSQPNTNIHEQSDGSQKYLENCTNTHTNNQTNNRGQNSDSVTALKALSLRTLVDDRESYAAAARDMCGVRTDVLLLRGGRILFAVFCAVTGFGAVLLRLFRLSAV